MYCNFTEYFRLYIFGRIFLYLILFCKIGTAQDFPSFEVQTSNSLSPQELTLFDEYKNALPSIRKAYSNIRLDYVQKTILSKELDISHSDFGDGERVEKYVSYRTLSSHYFRVDESNSDFTTKGTTIWLMNPKIMLKAINNENQYNITEVFQYPNSFFANIVFHNAIQWTAFALADITVYRIEMIGQAPNREVVFYFDHTGKETAPGTQKKATFYYDKNWVVKKLQISAIPGTYSTNIYYEGEMDGIPLIKRIEDRFVQNQESSNSDKYPYIHKVWDIISVIPEPSLDEFDPEKVLGIKIGGTGANWTMRLILLGIGLVLIAVWIYFKRKEKQKSGTSVQT